jgi:hypothetical protein
MFPTPAADPLADDGCQVTATPDVPVGPNSATLIKNALDAAMPTGSTPTTAAIHSAINFFNSSPADGHPRYLLLATDGEPNCNASLADDYAAAEQAVTEAANAGIHTFVVGIGSVTTDQQVLTTMAQNGGEPNTSGAHPYYEVSSTSTLVDVLDHITGQIATCSFALPQVPSFPDLVTVDVNGAPLARDPGHMNGWDFGPGDTAIELYGSECQDLKNGVQKIVVATYGC